MPGMNRMGPNNEGPMTGRRMGMCCGTSESETGNYRRGGFRNGCGRGQRNGRGLSGNLFPSGNSSKQSDITPELLKSQKVFLTEQLERIEKELSNLKTDS